MFSATPAGAVWGVVLSPYPPPGACVPGDLTTVYDGGFTYVWECEVGPEGIADWELVETTDPYFGSKGFTYYGPYLKSFGVTRLARTATGFKTGTSAQVFYANSTPYFTSTIKSYTDIQRWSGSTWQWCGTGTGWQNGTSKYAVGSQRTYVGAPCGAGSYRTVGYAYFQLNGQLFGGVRYSPAAFIPAPGARAGAAQEPPPSPSESCVGRSGFSGKVPDLARDLLVTTKNCTK